MGNSKRQGVISNACTWRWVHGPGTFFLFVYSTEEYNSSGTDHLVEGLGKKQMPACNGLDTTMRDMCGLIDFVDHTWSSRSRATTTYARKCTCGWGHPSLHNHDLASGGHFFEDEASSPV